MDPVDPVGARLRAQPEAKFYEILVPTVDTVRATWLLKLMVETRKPVVLIGETGTSKTATIANYLRTLDSEQVSTSGGGDSSVVRAPDS